jgi:SAM-dependent methyltransferase
MESLEIRDADVIRDISPNDGMLDGNSAHYFRVGRSALDCIDICLRAARKPSSAVRNLLDLPSGYGRVLRFLKVAFPEARITACDLVPEAVDYCASTFGAIPVYSHVEPAKIPLEPGSFDLIWVGSLFTHLDPLLWSEFLRVFQTLLSKGGLLVFSTHGRFVYDKHRADSQAPPWKEPLLAQFERTGCGYANTARAMRYGISITEPTWVMRQIAQLNELRLIHVCEKSWDNHHDIFGCVRDTQWRAGLSRGP